MPDQPESEYPFRGVRTGAKPPPDGFTAEDFRVPTLGEVMEEFPNTPINIEIKGQEDQERSSCATRSCSRTSCPAQSGAT